MPQAGAAYVFVHSSDGWSQQAKLVAGLGSGNAAGLHVALNGDRAVISRGGTSGTAGSVSVFERSGTTWHETGQLVASGLDPTAQYGASLALNGDMALVGAPGQAGGTGAVYVFQKLAAGWAQTAKLTAADGQPDDLFGAAIALQGDEVLVGAPDRGIVQTGWRNGAVYLFRQEGGSWYQDTDMQPQTAAAEVHYGDAVALAGRDLFVGAPGELRSNGSLGRVEIYSPYVTDAGVPLVVGASRGVLINDCGPEGGTMTVESSTQPAHGVIQMGTDGSFTYTPDAGFTGTDQSTYQAMSQSAWLSPSTTVTITVRDTSYPTLATSGVPAGWVRSAPTVSLSAHDDTSVSALEYRDSNDAAWQMYDAPIKVTSQGVSTYGMRSRDVFGNSSAGSFVVRFDSRRPTPKAPYTVTAKRGRTCTLKYRVTDPVPGSPTATVKIVIRDAHGRQVFARTLTKRPVNQLLPYGFHCSLPRGAYRYYVSATDAAGNIQTKVASNRLTVK
jgi:FG-GAP repeat/Bacterial Ig domain